VREAADGWQWSRRWVSRHNLMLCCVTAETALMHGCMEIVRYYVALAASLARDAV
jgi:hypothetical protein